MTEYATTFLSSQRGLPAHVMSIMIFFVIIKRAVLPGKKKLAEFDDERLKQIILKDNPIFLMSVLSAMMFVLSQAVSCLGDHREEPEMCYPVVQSCCVAMWFGCTAFAAHVLILPFKTSSYDITDFMRFNMSFHEQCQALVGIWSVVVVLFVFASGVALDEKLASFWMFTHTIEPWGLTVRGSLFFLTMLMMLIGLGMTAIPEERIRAQSERQQRRSRRLFRIAEYIRIKFRSTKPGEWCPALRYCCLILSIILQLSSLMYYHYQSNDYYEALKWHDGSVVFVSAGYILGTLFSATRPKSTSWWQKNFPNVAPLNFLGLGIYAVWSGNRFWGSGEIVLGVVGLMIRPLFLNARKLTANLAEADLDEHLSSSLTSSFVIIPSITFLIAEVFSCYTTELERGFCYQLFLGNWTVAMWLGLSFLVSLVYGSIIFKHYTFEDWCFFNVEATLENFSRCISAFITTALSFFIFGLRSFNVLQDEPPYNPDEIGDKEYKSAGRKLFYFSGWLCAIVLNIIILDATISGLKVAKLQKMTEVHEEEDLEGHTPLLYKIFEALSKIEARLHLSQFSVGENTARISSLYTEILFLTCIVGCIVQTVGLFLGTFCTGFARSIGIFIQIAYWLGVILHGALLTAYIFSDIESAPINVRKKTIVKVSFLSVHILKIFRWVYEGGWLWCCYDVFCFLITMLLLKAMDKNHQACADQFSVKERRQHLVLCFKIMVANLPTQLYFVGELVACLVRQLHLQRKSPDEHKFELLDNSCLDIFYGILPLALFNGFCIVQYINYGLYSEMQHNIENVATLNLTQFNLYRTGNSVVLIGLAVFAYSLRHENGYMDTRDWTTLYVLVGIFWTLVITETALTFVFRVYKLIAASLSSRSRSSSSSRPSLQKPDRDKLSMEERLEDRETSMWDGGSKGTKRTTVISYGRSASKQENTRKKSDEEKGRVFEISPGFL
ncbi:hypothetical protein TrST_g1914 [Triparma strigata]|nr:hypothetical protein TrST_g1914 [Triparma strigata]